MVIALGFAMHPVATETVAWAKSLDDVLATAFILAAFLAAWRAWEDPGKPRAGSAAGAVLFFGAALFSKESVAGLYPLFLFPLFLCGRPRRKPFALWFVGLSATLGVFLAARRLVLGHTAQVATPISGTYARTLLDMIPVARLYAVKLLGIPPFLPDYDFMQGGARLLSGDSLTGLALIGVFLALLVWACRQPRRRAAVWFGCLWLMLGLVPVSNVIPMMQYFAVRFAYLPLIGFLFVLGGLAQAMLPARPAAAVLVLLAAFWSVRTRHELPKWRDEPALMDYACRHGPLSKRIAVNYLIALFNAGDASRFEEVMRRYGRQLEGEPKIRWLEARRLADAGHPAEALAILEPLSGELGREREFMGHLGILHALTGNRDKARACLEEAVRRWPSDAGAWANLGQVLTESGSPSEALAAWQEAARLAPTNASFWQGLLHAAWAATNRPAARQALTALIGLDPDNPEHRRWLEALER
jgi:tetratricopeptide (TPR) repeat protein